jgi:hypothetical protein
MPLLGSGLAIAYEIGSFYPLGYGAFGFFSLTEHLLWALGALPIVLIVLAGAAIGLTVVSLQRSRNALRRRRPDAGRREKRFLRLSAVVLWALGSAGIWSGWTGRSAFSIVLGCMALAVGLAVLLPRDALMKRLVPLVAILFGFLTAIAAGFDSTREKLLYYCVADFAFNDGTRRAVLVRSGERGVLLYDPSRNAFTFDKWEDLKSVSWLNLPILLRAAATVVSLSPHSIRKRSLCEPVSSS